MKKILALLCAVAMALSLTACGVNIAKLTLPAEVSVPKGDTIQLDVGYEAEGKASEDALNKAAAKLELVWKSSDESIAKVDGAGKVAGIEAGTVDITVAIKDTDISATCKVTVTIPVEGVQAPDEMELTLNGNNSKEIGAKLVPENASGVKLVYESSDENIATVDENGVVTAVAMGTCTITTSVQPDVAEPSGDTDKEAAADSSTSASDASSAASEESKSEAASEPADASSAPADDADAAETPDYSNMKAETKVYVVTGATGIKLSSTSGSLKVGATANVSVFTEPDEADPAKADAVKYTSSDESVATVVGTTEGDAGFTVKGVKAGKATITVEYQGLTATYEVTVTNNSTQQKPSGGNSSTGGSTGNNTSTGGNTSGGSTSGGSGGGSVTPPAGGGETTTPPSGDGGGTTNPPSGGGDTTPPAPTPGPGMDNDTNLGDTHNPGFGTGDNQVIGKG